MPNSDVYDADSYSQDEVGAWEPMEDPITRVPCPLPHPDLQTSNQQKNETSERRHDKFFTVRVQGFLSICYLMWITRIKLTLKVIQSDGPSFHFIWSFLVFEGHVSP
jgi:hypothetical protein